VIPSGYSSPNAFGLRITHAVERFGGGSAPKRLDADLLSGLWIPEVLEELTVGLQQHHIATRVKRLPVSL